jgi:hypothetical protein
VIGAFHILSIEVAAVKRHAAVGTGVAERKGTADSIASYHQWDLEQQRLVQLMAMNAIGGQGAIPEAGEHERIGRLALGRVEFGHECGRLIFDCRVKNLC